MRDFLETLQDEAAKDPEQRARELSRRELPKRFYKQAFHEEGEGGFVIKLDGRPVKTPSKKLLLLPNSELAAAVAAEWDAQEKEINPAAMPLTRISNSAIDAVAERFAEVADDLAKYAGTDALCYRADGPETLVERQNTHWEPVLQWAEQRLGGRFVRIEGLIHSAQPDSLLSAYRGELDQLSALRLAGLHTVTTLTGSAVLALALLHGLRTPDEIWSAAHLEEDWNIEQWGEDAEAAEIRAYKRREFDAAVLILKAI
ncbi:chaperone required for assembly of F1-ATPase [Roseibium hamelinense]|uniref:Chaperone required for assembly of F1-ATPase n=1 Tax=Roseibium hamelinense TaxID=150831 RepID=A0A562SFL7_9HYPH|nr:ATP12 family protein [Roseibium hamelinense]MTI44150.1 ATPase [Roseibium hamelinense]TWI80068.1 chaperone required for assembly of F1-ATPase [Roseibium hamelinense]